jgi:hypothetical protein
MEEQVSKYVWKGVDLEKMRAEVDDPSDEAVNDLYKSKSMRHLSKSLKLMARNDEPVPEELPIHLKNFIDKNRVLDFSTEDIRMFNRSHEIWKEHGMKFVFILIFRALPYTYMAEKPANVLHMTKLLEEHTDRRIIETAQFVFDVMDKNWWEPDKRGILTALKIRIMHSAMRHIIQDSTNEQYQWNDAWGKPISQEDLIATNQVFSLEFIKGMKMIGQELSREDQDAWFHTWKRIAEIMGVQKILIADTIDDAWDLQVTVYDHLFNDETVAGKPLAVALVKGMHRFKMPERLVLFFMKTMLKDERFPNCFDRMLGEHYAEKYPDLFKEHDSPKAEEKHKKEVLHKHAHEDAMQYHNMMRDKKEEIKKQSGNSHEGILLFILDKILKLLGIREEKLHRIESEFQLLHKILHDVESGKPLEKLEEDSVLELITVFGGIMVSFLSVHFRDGKYSSTGEKSGFRIPKDLQEDWALKG